MTDPTQPAEYERVWLVEWVGIQPGVPEDAQRLGEVLAEGFEPFAVTGHDTQFVYHLRKKMRPEDMEEAAQRLAET